MGDWGKWGLIKWWNTGGTGNLSVFHIMPSSSMWVWSGLSQADSGCDIERGSRCTYHPGSVHCVRAIQPRYKRWGFFFSSFKGWNCSLSSLWPDVSALCPVLYMARGSSAAMTAQAPWCWPTTPLVAAPRTELMFGARLHTGSPLGCRGTPTGSMMSWVTTTAACGLTTATSTWAVDLPLGVTRTSPREQVRCFRCQLVSSTQSCCNFIKVVILCKTHFFICPSWVPPDPLSICFSSYGIVYFFIFWYFCPWLTKHFYSDSVL